jgi:hypothetical protein
VTAWREDARTRGEIIDRLKHRRVTNRPRGRRRDIFKAHWAEMLQCLEAQRDQTALELLVEFQARYPEIHFRGYVARVVDMNSKQA